MNIKTQGKPPEMLGKTFEFQTPHEGIKIGRIFAIMPLRGLVDIECDNERWLNVPIEKLIKELES